MMLSDELKKHAVYVEAYQMEMVPLSAALALVKGVDMNNQAAELMAQLDKQIEEVQKTINSITND